MTTFFTSDQHFFHKNIIGYCDRPFHDVGNMNEHIITNWNLKVTPRDKVYVLGDFSFGKPEETKSVYDRLNGEKILIRGNHDNHKTVDLFDEIHDDLVIKIADQDVLLSHYPYKYEEEDIKNEYHTSNGHLHPTPDHDLWLLHGHVHRLWQIMPERRMINVGVDVWGFVPISESCIRGIIARHSRVNTTEIPLSDAKALNG